METVRDFIFLGSRIIADDDCSHEIKRCLLLGRKALINLDSILKSRNITLPTKIHLVKAMVFPAVMYGYESQTIKKAEHRRIDAFELWCWKRLLRVPWTARRSNQSILREINPNIHWKDWCWSWNSILWPPDVKNWLIGKDPDAGKNWGQKEKGTTEDEMVGWHHWLDGLEFEQAQGVGDKQGSLVCCSPWGRKESDMTERLNWGHWLLENLKLSIQGTAFVPDSFNTKKEGRDHNFIWLWLPGSSEPKTTTCDHWKPLHSCHTPSLAIVCNNFSFGPVFILVVFTVNLLYVLGSHLRSLTTSSLGLWVDNCVFKYLCSVSAADLGNSRRS